MTLILREEQIERIARHALENPARPHRFNKEKYGPNLHIESDADLSQAIREAIADPKSKIIDRAQGGHIVWQPTTNLTLLIDGQGGGTAYRDRRFERDFERLLKSENMSRARMGIEAVQVRERGAAEITSRSKSPRITPELLERAKRAASRPPREQGDKDHDRER